MIPARFAQQELTRTADLLLSAHRIVVLTHMSPDGDAMGSSLGITHFLRTLPTAPTVTIVVPNAFPDFLAWMPDARNIVIYEQHNQQVETLLKEADLIVCTDFNEPYRIGAMGELLTRTLDEQHTPCILIDHHLNPADFATVTYSYPESPSASELVYRLIEQLRQLGDYPTLNQPLTLSAATCLYTGMMTDTGNFSFNSNHPDMYRIVGELVALGVDKDVVYDRVFNAYTADRMRLVGYCLNNKMQIFPEQHASFIALGRKELYRFNFRAGDAEGIVNMPLQIKDVYYSCFMREDKVQPAEQHLAGGSKTKIKISMRSQGDRPVNTFCHDIFNGGGHKNAAGGEYYGPLQDAMLLFMQHYKTYFRAD